MKKIISLLACFVILFSVTAFAVPQPVRFYVSPNGNDYSSGTESSPYKTINRAVLAVRYLRQYGINDNAEIILKEGEYFIGATVTLTDKNISFKGENAVITGGYTLDTADASDDLGAMAGRFPSDNVKSIDVSFVKEFDYPPEVSSAYFELSDYIVTLDGNQMTLARYPNDGAMTVKNVYESGNENSSGRFVIGYSDENISQWENPENVFAEGFGEWLWRYQKIRLASIDTENKKIYSNETKLFTSIHDGAQIWFSNIPEELDTENEYYIDRENKKLYFIEPSENAKITFSVLNRPFFKILGADNVSFCGITFQNVNTRAIEVMGSVKTVIDNCEIHNTGAEAVKFSECRYSGVKNSLIYNTGTGGILFSDCGRKYDLIPSQNFVLNNEICSYSQVIPTSSPAINVSGIKDIIAGNVIHDSYNSAVCISGNDNIISNNEIYNVLLGIKDAGAIYMWGDASSRGNIIENNFIHHIGNGKEKFAKEGLFGIYFDNFNSGQFVRNNILYDVPCGIHINGGNSITIENNVFNYVDVPLFAHNYTTHESTDMWNGYLKLKKDESVWLARYPELSYLPDPNEPEKTYFGNIFKNNLIACAGEYDDKISSSGTTAENNIYTDKDAFCDRNRLDYSLTVNFPNFIPFSLYYTE